MHFIMLEKGIFLKPFKALQTRHYFRLWKQNSSRAGSNTVARKSLFQYYSRYGSTPYRRDRKETEGSRCAEWPGNRRYRRGRYGGLFRRSSPDSGDPRQPLRRYQKRPG